MPITVQGVTIFGSQRTSIPANRYDTKSFYFVGQNIFELEPPKACARCKSRYWNQDRLRKTEYNNADTWPR